MKPLDILFAAAVSVLAVFVGTEAVATREARREARHEPRQDASETTAIPMTSDGTSAPHISTPIVVSARREPRREADLAVVRRRLENQAPGTFIGEMLASHDSALVRWPERRLQPLRVWIQPSPALIDWSPDNIAIVDDAFIDWADVGIPLSFTFVRDSLSADVHVTWTDRFDEVISGKTLWSHDERWWILEANIVLALHHRTGETLDADAMRAIALHEVGHLIGLDHTSDTTSIMTPRVRVKNLSPADRATAQLLYKLPPGHVGSAALVRQ